MIELDTGGGAMHRKRRIFCYTLFIILCIVVFLLIYTAISIVDYGKIDEKVSSDVAIVLGAGTSEGKVSPVYRERINHGIWLYENGYVDYLIFTGGIGKDNSLSDAYIAKQYAVAQNVPDEVIFIEEKSTITEENLQYSKCIMDNNDLNTAIIVSDPLHMKRAMLMAKDYGIKAYSSPTSTTMYKSLKTQIPFLAREEFFYIGYSIVRIFR